MKTKNIKIFFLLSIALSNISALPLKETLEKTFITNPEIKSIRSNTSAYKFYIDEAYSSYLPSVSFDYYLESKSSTNENTDTNNSTEKDQNGFNAVIKYEQLIFDGGLTPSKVGEAKYNYEANKIKNISKIENLLFDTLEAYLETVKYKELSLLSKNNIEIHEKYFEIARESEKVSGEKLDRLQTESKLVNSKAKYIKEKREANSKYETLLKFIGEEEKSLICRPILDTNTIETKENLLKKAISSNFLITEELEKIKAQRELINQKRASFLPTIKARLQKEYDDDIDSEGIYKEELSARITLSYNFFSGLKDKSSYLQEKEFLIEAQKTLDNQVRVVKEELNSEKDIFDSSIKRIKYLKEYVSLLKDILVLTQEQFDGGTKTFLEVLSSESLLYNAKKDLIEEEYLNLSSYYKLLNITSSLSKSVFNSPSQVCTAIKADISILRNEKKEEEISDLFKEEKNYKKVSKSKDELELDTKKEVDSMLNDLLDDVYEKEIINSEDKNNLLNENEKIKKLSLSKNKNANKLYTITLLESQDVKKSMIRLKKRYSLKDDILKYSFTSKNKRLHKITYGKYDSYRQALNDINNLPLGLQKNRPYVSLISKN